MFPLARMFPLAVMHTPFLLLMHAVPQIYGVHLPVKYLLCSQGKTLPRFLLPTITPRQRQITYIPRHCFSKNLFPHQKNGANYKIPQHYSWSDYSIFLNIKFAQINSKTIISSLPKVWFDYWPSKNLFNGSKMLHKNEWRTDLQEGVIIRSCRRGHSIAFCKSL